MTDQNKAAQAAILALMLPEQPGLAATVDAGYAAYRRGYNSAIGDAARVLSKLRAEGVQAAEPAFYINAAIINPETGRIKKNIQGALTWSETRVGGWQMPVYTRAALASAPVAGDAKAWLDLFWSVAKELNCLPSSFVDGNEHVLRAARQARAALAAPPTNK